MNRIVGAIALLVAATVGCGAPTAAAQSTSRTFRIQAPGVPKAAVDAVRGDLAFAEDRIARMLGPFPDSVSVRILASREGFSEALRDAWGMEDTACWMVGAASDGVLFLLSPAVWGEEACEHDPADEMHRRLLVTHEAVHAFHGLANPSEDIGLLEDLGWFIEGLATYVSGQLENSHAGRAREAIDGGHGPERLDDAWSGPYRYGVTGSMVAFIDQRWGRDVLRQALLAESKAALLTLLDVTEAGFLQEWTAWVP
jgi:hypothetical protein